MWWRGGSLATTRGRATGEVLERMRDGMAMGDAFEEKGFVEASCSILMYLLVAPLLEHTSSSSLGYCNYG
jgi:hypothetical protein